jgi:hypothetical protein
MNSKLESAEMSGSLAFEMRIIVCGSRKYADKDAVFSALDLLHGGRRICLVIHGAASGADRLADEWAHANGVPVDRNPVRREDWESMGLAAGPARNRRMLDTCRPDAVVAFPGDEGTSSMVELAQKAGVKVWFPMGRESVKRRKRRKKGNDI